jgi:hypothetical protein
MYEIEKEMMGVASIYRYPSAMIYLSCPLTCMQAMLLRLLKQTKKKSSKRNVLEHRLTLHFRSHEVVTKRDD